MRLRKVTVHQDEMYCSKCLLKILMALAILHRIVSVDIDLESKKISLAYKDDRFGKDKIKELIYQAIQNGQAEAPASLVK